MSIIKILHNSHYTNDLYEDGRFNFDFYLTVIVMIYYFDNIVYSCGLLSILENIGK